MPTTHLVHPALHGITKFFPNNPPSRGDIVLVKGFEGLGRCKVVRNPKIKWSGLRWTLRGPIRVKKAPKD